MRALVLGNGKSRLDLDLQRIKSLRIYACNRAYEDVDCDVLVSVDTKMAHEIQQTGYSKTHTHYTREQNIIPGTGALPIPKYAGWSSGPAATGIASLEGAEHVYLVGMDLVSPDKQFNNVYADTEHYKKTGDDETYYGNWEDQIQQCMKSFPVIKYFHVNPQRGYSPDKWLSCSNFARLTLEELYSMINI